MFRSDVQRWLARISSISQEYDWDRSLLIIMETDDRTFVVQVRKSALIFIARQEAVEPPAYTVTYTLFQRGAPPDVTARRHTAGQFREPGFVEAELEKWLRESVATYVTESGIPD